MTRVLLTVASVRRDHGGPAFAVVQLAAALVRRGLEPAVWAADGSALVSDLIEPGVTRLGGDAGTVIDRFNPDALHDNGIWLPHNHTLALTARRRRLPRVVSLHGMLEPWALKHKRWKKSLAWSLYQRRDLAQAQVLHATAPAEARHVADLKLGPLIEMIPNGALSPAADFARRKTPDGDRIALFLGRIYPVKGLPMLVEAWARIRPQGWRLVIAGPDEAGHQAKVAAEVEAHGLGGVISFAGPVFDEAKMHWLSQADFLVLPSYSENFGMVVAEALACGLPVLATRGAPWPQLETHRCGWWVEADVRGVEQGLRAALTADDSERQAMGQRGQALVQKEFSWETIARKMADLYQRIAS
ncbi:MAG: hypothetical protein JWM33_2931 [Caulobacteraceae bacterium]|nr:hypothetical protein [Caulobacteraceae bacterium]